MSLRSLSHRLRILCTELAALASVRGMPSVSPRTAWRWTADQNAAGQVDFSQLAAMHDYRTHDHERVIGERFNVPCVHA